MLVSNISRGNKALEFIDLRIQDEKYRGPPSSQHNRYVMQQMVDILVLFDRHAPNQELMTIRTTDMSKRPLNTPEEFKYSQFCNEVKDKTGIGTQDAMRKNLFVDIHRMGFIKRYNKNKQSIDPFSSENVKYVSLSDQGLRLIKAATQLDKFFIFSKGIDMLLGGHIDILLDILREKDYEVDRINIYEYMFFVSAIGAGTKFSINTNEAVNLIKAFRNLTPVQRKSVIEMLKSELNPKASIGKKTEKRDFHNWHNKVAQIYYLLNQTVYFEVRKDQLILKVGKDDFVEVGKRLGRSLSEKYKYFTKHGISKTSGFEIHHIVPLAWSESVYHFKILDKWENMIYIDGFSHAKITQNRNKNVVLDTNKEDIRLSDYSKNEVYLKYKKNILYKLIAQSMLKDYNTKLLKTVK